MSLSTDCGDPEHVEYHNWLLCIQDQQLREELLEIVSIFSNILQFTRNMYQSLPSRIFQDCNSLIFFQGFKWVLYTLVEAAYIIVACEKRLLVNKIIKRPFTAEEIRGGVLAHHLTMDDYRAPLEVRFVPFLFSAFISPNPLLLFKMLLHPLICLSSNEPGPLPVQTKWPLWKCFSKCKRRRG